jgi:hypothetical protein
MTNGNARYRILIPAPTLRRASDYLTQWRRGEVNPGARLQAVLGAAPPAELSPIDLLGGLFDTRVPRLFAESEVYGDGRDWTLVELGLLGDCSVAVPVTVFDNARHRAPAVHATPFAATLVFTAGALLRNGQQLIPADWPELTTADGRFSPAGYYALYERRLLAALRYINEHAARPRTALVTVPGLGCGQFAGPFQGTLGAQLRAVLARLLDTHGASLPNLRTVYFDPYSECENARADHHGITLLVRPLTAPGNAQKSQLCHPSDYAEAGDDFGECALYSLVAWDHVSWPGNDFYAGLRATDDGVKAAATSVMSSLTGVAGRYDTVTHQFLPPSEYRDWGEVVSARQRSHGLRLWRPEAVWTQDGEA